MPDTLGCGIICLNNRGLSTDYLQYKTIRKDYVFFVGEIEDRVLKSVLTAKSLGIVCEKCGSDEITEISYGLPGWLTVNEPIDARIEKLIKERFIVLGGCVKGEGSPQYYCRTCGNKFL